MVSHKHFEQFIARKNEIETLCWLNLYIAELRAKTIKLFPFFFNLSSYKYKKKIIELRRFYSTSTEMLKNDL